MRKSVGASVAMLAIIFSTSNASACEGYDFYPGDLERSYAVVVGRVSNYRIVRNDVPASSAKRQDAPSFNAEIPEYDRTGRYYGKFEVVTESVLVGKAPKKFSAIFPELIPCCVRDEGPYLASSIANGRYLLNLMPPSDFYAADRDLMIVFRDVCADGRLSLEPMPNRFESELRAYLKRKKPVTKKN